MKNAPAFLPRLPRITDEHLAMSKARWVSTGSEVFKKETRKSSPQKPMGFLTEPLAIYVDGLYRQVQATSITVWLSMSGAVSIPAAYSSWIKSIEDSRYIAGYTETDSETGEVTKYSHETWNECIRLLADISNLAYTEGFELPAPAIYDGEKGSIDIRWKTDKLRLLVNVPANVRSMSFYGDDIYEQSIKGTLHKITDLKNALLTILKSTH